MPKKINLSPQNIDHWPDILNEVEIKAIPLDYLKTVKVTLMSGEVIDFVIDSNEDKNGFYYIENYLDEIFEQYDQELDGVDFHLNIEKIKADIKNSTLQFLQKRN